MLEIHFNAISGHSKQNTTFNFQDIQLPILGLSGFDFHFKALVGAFQIRKGL